MLEMTLIFKIVIFLAFVLLCAGLMLYRRQANELARKTDELKEQKFKNKQARIIKEIAASLNPHSAPYSQSRIPSAVSNSYPKRAMSPETPVDTPSGQRQVSPPDAPHQATGAQFPKQPTFIVTPTQDPPLEPTAITNPIRTKEFLAIAEPGSKDPQGPVISKIPSQQMNSSVIAHVNGESPERQRQNSKPFAEQENDQSLPKIITNHVPLPGSSPEPEYPTQQSLLKAAFSSLTRKPNEPVAPNLQRRRGNAVSVELKLNEEDNLYKHINDYANWLVSQSPKFVIEHYHNGVLQENIPLIMDAEQLERKNGHWIDLFRPIDLGVTLKEHDSPSSALYCPFTAQSIDQLKKPAQQILAGVENDPSPRYERVIKECALNEFVDFLEDLKSLTASESS